MSRGKNLQEMEVGTKQSKTAVNAGAKPAEAMPTMSDPGTQLGSVEDLGGPTPENYKPDDDSAKLKTPGGTLKQVKDVVNKGAKPAEAMKGMKEEEELQPEETIEEEETSSEEVVAETTETAEEAPAEYDVEEDVNALLGGEELSEDFKNESKGQSLKQQSTPRLLQSKKNLKLSTLRNSKKNSFQRENHFLSVLILILSMLLMSGSKRTHSQLKLV